LTKLNYKHTALFSFYFAGMLVLMVLCVMSFPAGAQDAAAGKTLPEAENPIHITADSLITDPQNKTAEFIGHVLATQGDTTITSDRLKVYYRERSQSESTSGMDAIVRIVAQGMVTMVLDDQIAHTEHAEYIADKRIVIFTGSNSRIVNGNDSISGHKITLYRDDGRIHVAGTQKEPVEAVFYSEENVLGVPKKKN
jgi:lipopolysaccharide export system protein LptA